MNLTSVRFDSVNKFRLGSLPSLVLVEAVPYYF